MIVRDIMTTKLITVEPDDTLSHAANLLRQHKFHHLPVTRTITLQEEGATSKEYTSRHQALVFEGVLTSHNIEVAVALSQQESSSGNLHQPWQEQRVIEVMQGATLHIVPTTSVAAAAQLLIERSLGSLPVVEYGQGEQESKIFLVGLLTRSDLLLALARAMGAFEPGVEVEIALPTGSMLPLAEALRITAELHIPIRSLIAAPLTGGVPQLATLRVGTINPAPLLVRLQQAGIHYTLTEGETYA